MRCLALLGLLSTIVAGSPAAGRDGLAPLLHPRGDIVPNSYIVMLKERASASSFDGVLSALSVHRDHVYQHAIKGFAAKLDAATVTELRKHPDVDFIEHDAIVKVNGYVVQKNAPWNLARISHRKRGSTEYVSSDTAGAGTCSYIIDTGVDATHPLFGGRASQIKTFVGGANTDGNGHGTHLAGIIGANTYGVARKTKILGVKALDDSGSGPYSVIIAAMDFVAKDYKTRGCPRGAMCNMSIGGSYSAAVNKAAASLVSSGVFTSVAAGGSNMDLKGTSPASEPTVCTVGASNENDERASNSNYGPGLDIFAPGANIISTWLGGKTATLSGSSMSAAHITGIGAYIASLEGFPGAQQLCKRLQDLATKNVLKNVPSGTPNLLAFNGNPTG
ncbi:hypothetical protein QQS21_010573 [Conoideocrella luteorostrata]|uniref:Uncharacterized protein n=1 Tax=Conoideocrella luteorostrata TaxID=1105319 RepID=A0AAJ0FU24_9HYPO|nr:hypothetical protein QQS21_010573 [Conoideocrella luteorostrata]